MVGAGMPAMNVRTAIPARAGVGLRFAHHRAVIEERPPLPWFEVHTENYLGGGPNLRALEDVRRLYPVSLHGVGLSLGSAQGLDATHLDRVADLADRIEPSLLSDHLSWCVVDGHYLPDLLPLPMTEEALTVVCRNVDAAQQHFRRQILVENPSSYLRYRHSTIPEWEFLAAVSRRTGCAVLCDVNNIHVSACNHGWSAQAYLDALPADAVAQIHLAGHSLRALEDGRAIRIDDHGSRVAPEVWALYRQALLRFGPLPTLIEWDNDIPPLDVLLDEAAIADRLLSEADHDARRAVAA